MKMTPFMWVVLILLVIGGLNWGLVGIFQFDLVATLFGEMSALSRIVYTIVGICAVVTIISAIACCSKEKHHEHTPQTT